MFLDGVFVEIVNLFRKLLLRGLTQTEIYFNCILFNFVCGETKNAFTPGKKNNVF